MRAEYVGDWKLTKFQRPAAHLVSKEETAYVHPTLRLTGMVGLHSLQREAEEAASFAVNVTVLGDDGALDVASRPEGVFNRAPGVLGVGAVIARSVLSSHEPRSCPGELEVD